MATADYPSFASWVSPRAQISYFPRKLPTGPSGHEPEGVPFPDTVPVTGVRWSERVRLRVGCRSLRPRALPELRQMSLASRPRPRQPRRRRSNRLILVIVARSTRWRATRPSPTLSISSFEVGLHWRVPAEPNHAVVTTVDPFEVGHRQTAWIKQEPQPPKVGASADTGLNGGNQLRHVT